MAETSYCRELAILEGLEKARIKPLDSEQTKLDMERLRLNAYCGLGAVARFFSRRWLLSCVSTGCLCYALLLVGLLLIKGTIWLTLSLIVTAGATIYFGRQLKKAKRAAWHETALYDMPRTMCEKMQALEAELPGAAFTVTALGEYDRFLSVEYRGMRCYVAACQEHDWKR